MTTADHPGLHHTEHGPADGVPVLAIHGWTPDHRLMTGCCEPVFSARERAYRRLYPDLPAMGRTPAGDVACSEDIMACLDVYLDEHVGDAPFLLLGESYGGYLARALAARRPEQVLGMALICPVGQTLRREQRDVPEHRILVQEIDVDPESEFHANAVVQTEETYRRAEEEIAVGVELADTDALERIEERWELDAEPETGAPFEGPSVIITGRQDSAVGYRDQWAILEHYPRATFAVLDAAGHNAQIERPELFSALLHDWLDRVEQAAASTS